MSAEFDYFGVEFDPSIMQVYLGAFLAVGAVVFLLSKLTASAPPISSSASYNPGHPRRPRSGTSAEVKSDPAVGRGHARAPGQPAGPAPISREGRSGRPPAPPGERRRSMRRKGKPVKVLLTDPTAGEPPLVGWVVDRSRGGLGVVVPRPLRTGVTLDVKAFDAPENLAPIQVKVRSCRRKGHRWVAGCMFTSDLPWGVLLLFG